MFAGCSPTWLTQPQITPSIVPRSGTDLPPSSSWLLAGFASRVGDRPPGLCQVPSCQDLVNGAAGGTAAVDGQALARDVGRERADREQDDVGDVIRPADPAEGKTRVEFD